MIDVAEPCYAQRKSATKLDDYELALISWLFRESRRHRKQRDTVICTTKNTILNIAVNQTMCRPLRELPARAADRFTAV